ncbi:MAG: metallophosphoesterase [Oscillospiraceae bacterium]|nr:metallophosphoesterase [Oscillospiraceae bacterium]
MALFAIADLHLSFGTDKPMDDFNGWDNYTERLEENWQLMLTEEDTTVIAGDISWGMTLEGARADFAFLDALPGTKIIVKGNHDYWWDTRRKIELFWKSCGFTTLKLLHNNCIPIGESIAVCGTRGWFFDAESYSSRKILLREVGRLTKSIQSAVRLGRKPIVFLHYPPIYADAVCEEIWDVLKEYQIDRVYYGHIHGSGIRRAVTGKTEGMALRLISGDSLGFMPLFVEN